MGKDKRPKKQKEKTPRMRRRLTFRRRQQSTSIYFLLWTVFSVLSLLVVILFSVTQQFLFARSYKGEASREIGEKGRKIHELVLHGPPDSFVNNNYNGYIRFLSDTYNVDIMILDETGHLIHPKDPNIKPESPEYKEYYHHEQEAKLLLEKLSEENTEVVIYEGESEYVYGAKVTLYGETPMYLHVGRSLELMETTLARMNARTILLGVFIFIITFAVSSAVAGWLVHPITELTDKAHLLAHGNFDVDFHGNAYGSELVELAETLNFARDELSKTDRMQKELIANVSHDFKTPLTMIKGYASMIIEISGDNPEKRNKHAKVIVDEADRLSSLVTDVLDLSKIRSGITQLEEKEIDMSAYLAEILDRFAYLKDTQGYEFIVDADEGLCTRADEVKIGQVLYNLIGNAVNYTGANKKVFIALKKQSDSCFSFSVTDTGAGIKREELGEIWERYYRSSETHKRPVKGTGLGLSIVKTVLERHGFRFGVESEPGKGSTFYVLFPLIQEDAVEGARQTVDSIKK